MQVGGLVDLLLNALCVEQVEIMAKKAFQQFNLVYQLCPSGDSSDIHSQFGYLTYEVFYMGLLLETI